MPYLHESLAKQKALAEAPTLGNLHPDARAQAIARAGIAEAEAMRKRMDFLHSSAAVDAEGYEWGVFRVKWENGRAVDVQRVRADHSDLDAVMAGAFWCEALQKWLYKDESRKAFKNRPMDPQPTAPAGVNASQEGQQ